MATKTRSKKNTTPTEEVTEMTDTATTTEVTTEASAEAPATTPVAEAPAAPAAAPAAPKPEVDHEGNLFNAIMAYSSDRNLENLQDAYRQVPVAARGKVQGLALKNAMNNGVDLALLGEILEAFSNMPTATKTTRVKPDLDPAAEAAVRLTGLMIGFENLRKELGDEAFNQATAWYNRGTPEIPEEYRSYVDGVATSVQSNTRVKTSGQRGPRSTFTQSFADLVQSGVIPVGAQLTGAGNVTATVIEGGKIQTEKGVFDAPSAAVKGLHTTKDGKETSTNGWKFWQYNGKSIGELRQS